LFNKSTFSYWFMKNKQNKQIININCYVSSILILISSFDNKHTINVTLYTGFDVYVQFQRKEREECQGVYLDEDNVSILEVERMKTEDNKMCNLEKIRSKYFLLIYIYIYIYIYRVFCELKFSRYRCPHVWILWYPSR